MQVIEVDGVEFHYDDFGDGRPIVMLHGWPGDHHLMEPVLEPLFDSRPGWRRIYPDLPGMGETPGPDSITDQVGMLRATLAFIDALIPGQRLSLVGISYGGYLALGVLHEIAERLDGLMLWSPGLVHPDKARRPDHVVLFHDPAIDDDLAEDERQWLEFSVVQTPATLAAFRATVKPGLVAADRTFLRRVAPGYEFPFDVRLLDRPFAEPSLFVVGRQDSAVGYEDLVELSASFPRATLAVLDRAGHGVAEEQHTVFRALAGDWLDRVALGAGAGA